MGFWDKTFSGSPQSAPAQQAPARGTRAWWDSPTPYAPQAPAPEPLEAQPAIEEEYTTNKAVSARMHDTCPSCGSGNYTGGSNSMVGSRCFECGFNGRFDQQAYGGSTSGGPVTPAKQGSNIASGGYQPGVIVSRSS